MTEPIYQKWASAYFNGDVYIIKSKAGYGSCVHDPKGYEEHLQATATDEEVGGAVVKAVAHSRFVRPDDAEEFEQLHSPTRIAADYASWVTSLLERHRYKTRRALFKNMDLCGVTVTGEEMEFTPMRHEKLEGWVGLELNRHESVLIPANSSFGDIGGALRLALSRCE